MRQPGVGVTLECRCVQRVAVGVIWWLCCQVITVNGVSNATDATTLKPRPSARRSANRVRPAAVRVSNPMQATYW
jgi:hypothetical protein